MKTYCPFRAISVQLSRKKFIVTEPNKVKSQNTKLAKRLTSRLTVGKKNENFHFFLYFCQRDFCHRDTESPRPEILKVLPPLISLGLLSEAFLASINMILQLNSDLSLCWLVTNEGMLQQLFRGWTLSVVFDKNRFHKGVESFGPSLRLESGRWIPWN